MPQLERRLYQPSDEIRGFDAEESFEDEGSRLPLLIVIALVVLASFAGVVWLAYTQGVQRGRQDAPRIMAAEPQAAAPAKPKNPYADLKVYQQPKPQADTDEDTAPLPPTEVKPKVAAPSTMASAYPPAANVAKPAPPPVAVAKASPPVASKPVRTGPVTFAPPVLAPVPATGAPRSIMPPAMKPATAQQKPMAPAVAKPSLPPSSAAPTATQAAAPGVGGFVLQIASYTSDAEASASWQTYRAAHSSVAGFSPDVQKADLGKKGTWYRLRVGPFTSMAEASAACAKLKAQGGNCFPTKR
jgi:hypothetical protein